LVTYLFSIEDDIWTVKRYWRRKAAPRLRGGDEFTESVSPASSVTVATNVIDSFIGQDNVFSIRSRHLSTAEQHAPLSILRV
jgi:hypothetical protein